MNELGQDTVFIIIIHTLLDSRVQKMGGLRFVTYMVCCITLELIMAVAVKYVIILLTSLAKKRSIIALI